MSEETILKPTDKIKIVVDKSEFLFSNFGKDLVYETTIKRRYNIEDNEELVLVGNSFFKRKAKADQ